VLFYPPDPGLSNGRIRDKQTKFVNSLYTKIGRIRCFFTPRIRDEAMVGSGIKHPGSATLAQEDAPVDYICLPFKMKQAFARDKIASRLARLNFVLYFYYQDRCETFEQSFNCNFSDIFQWN
jgi:hypothetical protein